MDVWNSTGRRLAPLPPRQADAAPGASGIDPVQLSSPPRERTSRAGTSRAARCSSRPGWRAASAARRAAMTRWCGAPRFATIDRFFSPLGLEAEGTQIDFQVGVNDYLYGTRFFSYLALTYGPEKVGRLAEPSRGQQGLLRRPVQAGVRQAARRGLERLDRVRAQVPEGKPRQARAISADRDPARSARTASARCRAASSTRRPTA